MNKSLKRFISLLVASLLVLSTATLPVVADATSLFDFQMKDKTDSQVVGMFQEKSINSVVTTNDADGYINFIVNSSAVNDGQRYLLHGFYGAEKAYTGKITLEGRFKLTGTSNATLIPFAVTGKSPANNGLRWFNSTSPTVYAKNGKWYAVNTTSGYSYTSGATAIADVKEDVFYTLKIHYNIDGDTSTVDTYTYELIEEGGATYTADTARYFGGNIAESAGSDDRFKINYDIEKITCIAVSGLKVSTYDSTNPQGFVWDYAKGYMTPATAPVVTSSLEDGATGVEAGTVVTLNFTEEMDTTTFANIKLYKGATPVDFAAVETANNKTYKVTLPTLENADYSIVIPATVVSVDELGVTETVINFTGYKNPNLFNYDLKNMTEDETWLLMTRSPFYATQNGASFGTTSDGYMAFVKGTDTSKLTAHSYVYYGHDSGEVGGVLNYTGKFTIEGKFRLNSVGSKDTYVPFALGWSANSHPNVVYRSSAPALYVSGGKWYAVNSSSADLYYNTGTQIATAKEDVFYTLKLHYNIDGDSSTVDTYKYELIEEGGATYVSSAPLKFGAALERTSYGTAHNATKATAVVMSSVTSDTTGFDSTNRPGMIWDYVKGYETPAMAPVVSHNIADTSKVEAGTVVTLTFTEEMDTATFANIKLKKGATEIAPASVEIVNNTTYKITLPTVDNAEYSIVVPSTVVALNELSVAETVINFTGFKDTVLFDYDLTSKTADQVWALFSSNGPNEKSVSGLGLGKNDDGYYVFKGSASTVEQARFFIRGRYGNEVNYAGKFTLEGRFMLSSVSSVKYFPFAVGGKSPADNTSRWYNSTSPALYVENGKWYAADVTSGYAHTDGADYIADAKEDVFYTLKINYNIDGDPTTVDTYTFELIEEDTSTNYGDGVSRHFGGNIAQNDGGDGRFLTNYDIEKVTSVVMSGMFQSAHNADNPTGYVWDYMKGYMTPAKTPVVTSSLEDGATNVTTGTVVTLTFTEEMDTATFANIKLMKGATPVAINPVPVNKKTCTVTLPELETADYQLVIPATVVSLDEMPVSETVINFTGKAFSVEVTPSDVKVNGSSSLDVLPTDVELVVTANFTNTGTVANQKALLVAAVYGSDNIMKKIAYMPETLAVGQTKPMQATFGNYRAASGDYIKVFVWDDFSTMVPMANVVRFPAE